MRRSTSRAYCITALVSVAVLVLPATGWADQPAGDEAAGASADAAGVDESGANESSEPTKSTRKRKQHTAGEKTYDALVLRPIDFLGLIVSSAAFVPAAILTAPTGRTEIEVAADVLVVAPAENVFQRRLGDF